MSVGPTVSVLIPVFNQHQAYLRAALISAKLQTYPCEIIVVDDGSDPGCLPIVTELLSPRHGMMPKYIWQENKGVADALNKAIEMSTGEYICWLPSDDLFLPDKTKIQFEAMLRENAVVSYCAWEEGIPQALNTWPAAQYPTREKLFSMLCQHSFINAATVIWHRSVFDEVGVFNETLTHSQDAEMILRCAERWNFLAVNETLVRRRIHGGQMSLTLKEEDERLKKQNDIDYMNERYGANLKVWVPA